MKKLLILFAWTLSLALTTGAHAQGDAAAGQNKSLLCASCHGADGNSTIAQNPKLAGQSAKYLVKQLNDYKSGARSNITMTAMVAGLSDQDILDIAAWYASQQPTVGAADPATVELAETLYRAGNPEIAVAACTACHSPTGKGNDPAGFPSLSGQHAEYTLAQLQAFRAGERANDPNAMMRSVVERLTDRELQALASYLSGLH
ncbi:MAG: hypothetical protein RLZZ385_718 [Pseudomonadota bacterium]|jgi:cytochrome c553